MHLQAITTKYIGPSNTRWSRIKAVCDAGTLTMDYDQKRTTASNHALAARALAVKLAWSGAWVSGGLPKDAGNVYVRVCADISDPCFEFAFRVP